MPLARRRTLRAAKGQALSGCPFSGAREEVESRLTGSVRSAGRLRAEMACPQWAEAMMAAVVWAASNYRLEKEQKFHRELTVAERVAAARREKSTVGYGLRGDAPRLGRSPGSCCYSGSNRSVERK